MEPADKFAASLSLLAPHADGGLDGGDDNSDEVWIDVIQKMDGIYADLLTSQVQLEDKNEELEEAHQFIDSILSSMTDVLVVCDLDCNIKQVNAALVSLTGRDKDDLLKRQFGDLVHESDVAGYHRFCDSILDHRELADFELSLTDANARAVPLSFNCSWMRDRRNRVVGLVIIGRSVGELKAAYSKLDKAHQSLRETQQQLIFTEKMAALGRLVAGVAHELNNPISFISGNAYVLKRYGQVLTQYIDALESRADLSDLQDTRERLKVDKVLHDLGSLIEGTVEGVERVSDIVHDLKRFSSKQSEPKSEFDLVPVVNTASNWVIRSAKVKPKLFHNVEGPVLAIALKGYVHQIVVNLIQNSVDILDTVEDGEIHIGYRRENGFICVEVRDNGPGIDEDILPHIFEPFFTTKPIGKGTGLGLSVSFNMAEELGGKLLCANRKERGALFTLMIPMKEEG
ncbi:ATP-binding protein [Terasakiella pusilla]|uniref:PAS domain-containing sensor histidine kinase n=1 Tax=Terasakiella pusilla TaxID=64973 RepID=UPI003AA89D97